VAINYIGSKDSSSLRWYSRATEGRTRRLMHLFENHA